MKEISKDMLYTILSGVGVFVVSQWVMEFILKPVISFNELKGRIASNIVYAAQYYGNPLSRENFWDLSISEKYKSQENHNKYNFVDFFHFKNLPFVYLVLSKFPVSAFHSVL